MVSSTEIPKAILKTKIVDGFIGMLKYPINPAVINNGNMFGINEIKIILNDRAFYFHSLDVWRDLFSLERF